MESFFTKLLNDMEEKIKNLLTLDGVDEIIGIHLRDKYESIESSRHKGVENYLPNYEVDEQRTRDREIIALMGLSFPSFTSRVATHLEPAASMILESLLDLKSIEPPNPELSFFVDAFSILALRSDLDAITTETAILTAREIRDIEDIVYDRTQPSESILVEVIWNIEKRADLIALINNLHYQKENKHALNISSSKGITDFISLKPLTPSQIHIFLDDFLDNDYSSFIPKSFSIEENIELNTDDCRLSNAFVRCMNRIQCRQFDVSLENLPYFIAEDFNAWLRAHEDVFKMHRKKYLRSSHESTSFGILQILKEMFMSLKKLCGLSSANLQKLKDQVETLASKASEEGIDKALIVETKKQFENVEVTPTESGKPLLSVDEADKVNGTFSTLLNSIKTHSTFLPIVAAFKKLVQFFENRRTQLTGDLTKDKVTARKRSWSQYGKHLWNHSGKIRRKYLGMGGDPKNRTRKLKWN